MKKCSKCNQIKSLTEFRFHNKRENVLQTQCKQCCKVDGKKHYRHNKELYVNRAIKRNKTVYERYQAFKSTLECQCCGESFAACLEFHHVDPNSKEDELANMARQSWKRFAKELDKCVCVCANCHRKIHAGALTLTLQRLQDCRYSLMEKALVFETSG